VVEVSRAEEGAFKSRCPAAFGAALGKAKISRWHTALLEELEGAAFVYFDQPMGVLPGVRRGFLIQYNR